MLIGVRCVVVQGHGLAMLNFFFAALPSKKFKLVIPHLLARVGARVSTVDYMAEGGAMVSTVQYISQFSLNYNAFKGIQNYFV
jgi:hypothetical protein